MGVFKTKLLYFKIKNTPIKDTNRKRQFKRMVSFLFVDKRELFAIKLSFEEFNLVFFTTDPCGSERLACFEPTEAARCLKKVEGHSVYSMVKERTGKGIFVMYKGFIDVFYILHRRERQPQSVHLNLTCVNGSTIQLHEVLFRINLWVLKIFK